jgi:hypothetical protein
MKPLVKRIAVLFVLASLSSALGGCAYFSVLHHNLERSFGTQTTSKSK